VKLDGVVNQTGELCEGPVEAAKRAEKDGIVAIKASCRHANKNSTGDICSPTKGKRSSYCEVHVNISMITWASTICLSQIAGND
jgi:hypothetical protein